MRKPSRSMSSLGEILQYVFFDLDVLPPSRHVLRQAAYTFYFKLLRACAILMNYGTPQTSMSTVRLVNFVVPLTIDTRFAVRLADPANNDAKMKLAEIYEIMGEPRKALDLVYEGM